MERDDLIVNESYALNAHHSEEKGVKIRKKIVFVTVLLSAITFLEVLLGAQIKQDSDYWGVIKILFLLLTLLKAGYIVLSFMHLGDERKNLRYAILMPYGLFVVYLLSICLVEGGYTEAMHQLFH